MPFFFTESEPCGPCAGDFGLIQLCDSIPPPNPPLPYRAPPPTPNLPSSLFPDRTFPPTFLLFSPPFPLVNSFPRFGLTNDTFFPFFCRPCDVERVLE